MRWLGLRPLADDVVRASSELTRARLLVLAGDLTRSCPCGETERLTYAPDWQDGDGEKDEFVGRSYVCELASSALRSKLLLSANCPAHAPCHWIGHDVERQLRELAEGLRGRP